MSVASFLNSINPHLLKEDFREKLHFSITLFMEKLPTLRVTLFMEELPTLRVTLFYYHPSITLFMEKLPTLRVITLLQEKLPTLRVITLLREKLPTLRVIHFKVCFFTESRCSFCQCLTTTPVRKRPVNCQPSY